MSTSTDPIKDMIDKTSDWRGKTLAVLRKVIHNADPDISEEVKWRRPSNPIGVPVWEHNGIVCVGNILKKSVRLTFFSGKNIPDPKKLFNSRLDSKTVRAIDIYENEKINETALKAIIKSGVKFNLSKTKPAKSRITKTPKK
jgi:hypothetical protein